MSKKMEIVYLVVGDDELSLPIAEFDSVLEIAIWFNCTEKQIKDIIKNKKTIDKMQIEKVILKNTKK